MATGAKRRKADGPSKSRLEEEEEEEEEGSGDQDSDSELESDSEEDEEEINEEVNIEFEAHTVTDGDKNGIKKLLQQLFLKAPINTGDLTDILIQQNHIGSVIKGTECAEQIKELVLSQCEENCEQNVVEQLDKLLSDTTKPVGFLLSERFINVPPQIALPMHQQLQKEIAEAQRTNKPCGKCYFYLLISKTYTTKKNAKKRGSATRQKVELMFSNAEEEFFYEQSVLKFSYSVEEESDSCLGGRWSFEDTPMKPLRTVMVIPADRMNAVMEKFKEYLSV
ncbi:BRCA2 and CDKN1A-interacting protein isoform X2 [Ahaetulla prasina]|uniref:BRCA2 and CDKN1A-interacting protein isoform X2 n=1 Tax=Ahaetulla prasina TaxID=499056 RepID=UPI0026485819|nr:BRCA2 and CDKN1A-interacting protein isoform X2 [Ahaetulla prasina]